MKTEKTYLQLHGFALTSKAYIEKNKETENKLCASATSMLKQLRDHFDTYNDEVDNLQINNCALDQKTRVILKDEKGNRQFTPEAEIKLKGEIKELLKTKVTVHQRIADGINDLIGSLTEEEKNAFSGFIIPEQKSESDEKEVKPKSLKK